MRGDLLDLILLVLAIAFAVSGYRQGFIVGVSSFIGFVGGAIMGLFIAPPVARSIIDDQMQQALLGLVIVFLAATIGQFASATLGAMVRSRVTWQPARTVDAVGGTVASVLAVLVIAWIFGKATEDSPFPALNQQIKNSATLTTMDEFMPGTASGIFASFKSLVSASEFPPVFGQIGGEESVDVAEPDRRVLKTKGLRQARKSVVKVSGTAVACGQRSDGSGFVYARGLVMTNAHVLAGVDRDIHVVAAGRSYPATVVRFNPGRDIAILRVPDLPTRPLRFDRDAETGADAVVAGFPHGRGFHVEPARVARRQNATASDIYHRGQVTREIYSVRARVEPGNSGGPLLAANGRVYGVIFAAATDQPNVGYALTADEVRSDAVAGRNSTQQVSTGDCD